MTKMKKMICSICGLDYPEYGNNAQPINDGRCCDGCNDLVIARRLHDMIRRQIHARTNNDKHKSND